MAKGSKLIECDERMLKAIELLLSGESDSETARLVGVNRKTIADWKTRDFFKAELDRQVTLLKSNVENKILTNLNPLLDKLMSIALKSDSDKTSLDAVIYAINRVAGTPTNKQVITKETNKEEDNINIDSLINELDIEDDNVIELDKVAR